MWCCPFGEKASFGFFQVCGLQCSSAQQLGGHQNSHRGVLNAALLGTKADYFSEAKPASRKRKSKPIEHADFEYGDVDDADEAGGALGAARKGACRSPGEEVHAHAAHPRFPSRGRAAEKAARKVPPAGVQVNRVRPTNNQLLYRAYFRWDHFPAGVEDPSLLVDETEPCASVTSAFLKILLGVYNAECQRLDGPRNLLQALATNTRRTKVVELTSGGHRVPEDLRRHTLEDEEGNAYSTTLDRNRYGNDDNYLSTVVRHNLEFVGLCPCLVDIEIIDAKSRPAKNQLVAAPADSCTCGGHVGSRAGAAAAAAGVTPGLLLHPTSFRSSSPASTGLDLIAALMEEEDSEAPIAPQAARRPRTGPSRVARPQGPLPLPSVDGTAEQGAARAISRLGLRMLRREDVQHELLLAAAEPEEEEERDASGADAMSHESDHQPQLQQHAALPALVAAAVGPSAALQTQAHEEAAGAAQQALHEDPARSRQADLEQRVRALERQLADQRRLAQALQAEAEAERSRRLQAEAAAQTQEDELLSRVAELQGQLAAQQAKHEAERLRLQLEHSALLQRVYSQNLMAACTAGILAGPGHVMQQLQSFLASGGGSQQQQQAATHVSLGPKAKRVKLHSTTEPRQQQPQPQQQASADDKVGTATPSPFPFPPRLQTCVPPPSLPDGPWVRLGRYADGPDCRADLLPRPRGHRGPCGYLLMGPTTRCALPNPYPTRAETGCRPLDGILLLGPMAHPLSPPPLSPL